MYIQKIFTLIFTFILGSFFNKLLTETHKLEDMEYVIPFRYSIELIWIPIILLITSLFLYINKYKIKKVLIVEIFLFSFLLGTSGIITLVEGLYKIDNKRELTVLILTLILILILFFYKDEKIIYKKPIEEIYTSRLDTIKILDKYLERNNIIGLDGKWGIGKTCFIENFIYLKKEKYIPIYIDTSIYSNVFKIIETIGFEIDKILKINNISPIGLNSLKKIIKEYNWFIKFIFSILDDDNVEDNKIKLKNAVNKIKNKKIILYLDNIERIHKENTSKIIELLALVEEMFKGNGIKIVLCYEKNYIIESLKIDETYLNKYIEREIELKAIKSEEILDIFKNEVFKNEYMKIIRDISENRKKYEVKNKRMYISGSEEERKITILKKQEIENTLNRINLFLNSTNTPREIKRIYEYWEIFKNEKFSSKTIIWYFIIKNNFDNTNIINKIINADFYLFKEGSLEEYLYNSIFIDVEYFYKKLKTGKEFYILANDKITDSEEEILKEFDENSKNIMNWDMDIFLNNCIKLDSILLKNIILEKIKKIEPYLMEFDFILHNMKEYEKLLKLSICKELLVDIFNGNIKVGEEFFVVNRGEIPKDIESTKCYLALRLLENERWIEIILREKMNMRDNTFRTKKNLIDLLSNIKIKNINEQNCVRVFFDILEDKVNEYFTENEKYLKFKQEVEKMIKASKILYHAEIYKNNVNKKYIKKEDIILKESEILSYIPSLEMIRITKKEKIIELTEIYQAEQLKIELDELINEFLNDSEFGSYYITIIIMLKIEIDKFITDKNFNKKDLD